MKSINLLGNVFTNLTVINKSEIRKNPSLNKHGPAVNPGSLRPPLSYLLFTRFTIS